MGVLSRKLNMLLILTLTTGSVTSLGAQSFYNENSEVSVSPNTIFSVQDSLVNKGTFINNGSLVIGGTWLNTGTYDAGSGEITFNNTSSTAPQIINHSNQSFSKLTISGGGTKLILADITVTGEMILADGVIEAGNNSKVLISAAATISGGSDQSHIHAPVYHTGPGHKIFPVGDGTTFLPVELLAVEGVDAHVGVTVTDLQGATLEKSPALTTITDKRYWHIDVVSGSVSNSLITLPVRDEPFTDPSQIVVAQASAPDEKFESIGQSSFDGSLANGRITSERPVTLPFVTLASATDNGSISVYNAVSPNGDGLNDYLRIHNIERAPDNKVRLFNRWGDKVFEMNGYDNKENVFRGLTNVGGDKELPAGTYYYIIEPNNGTARVDGYLSLKK